MSVDDRLSGIFVFFYSETRCELVAIATGIRLASVQLHILNGRIMLR